MLQIPVDSSTGYHKLIGSCARDVGESTGELIGLGTTNLKTQLSSVIQWSRIEWLKSQTTLMLDSNDIKALTGECPEADRAAIYTACRIVAMADGRVWREADVVNRIGDDLQLPKKAQREIARQVQSGLRRCDTPASHAGKRLMFEFALDVATADGELTERERRVVLKLGRRLGLPAAEVHRRLTKAGEGVSQGKEEDSPDDASPVSGSLEDDLRSLGRKAGIMAAMQVEQGDVFARIKASPEFAERDSEERLKQLPRASRLGRAGWIGALVVLAVPGILVALLISTASISAMVERPEWHALPIVIGIVLFALICGIMMSAVPAGVLWLSLRSIRTYDSAPVTTMAAIIESKQIDSKKRSISYLDDRGRSISVDVSGTRLMRLLALGDAGVLFVQNDQVVDFDIVLSIFDAHMRDTVQCPGCETLYESGRVPSNCRNCGTSLKHLQPTEVGGPERKQVAADIPWMERLADDVLSRTGMVSIVRSPTLKQQLEAGPVTCGWCNAQYEARPSGSDCGKCGGPLPLPPGAKLGDPPPPPPRKLPGVFVFNLFVNKYACVAGLLMVLFAVMCFPLFLVPMVPLLTLIAVYGLFVAYRRWVALKRGVAVPGTIAWIESFYRGETTHRYRVFFHFDVDGQPYRGVFHTRDSSIENHFTGEAIWVVHVPGKPHLCATWPPFARGKSRIAWKEDPVAELKDIGARFKLNDDGEVQCVYLDNCTWFDDESGLHHLPELTSLEELWLKKTQVTDAGLTHIKVLPNLNRLGLAGTRVTDRGLEQLQELPGLKALDLSQTRVTDAGLATLSRVTTLRDLYLCGTKITDDGISHLRPLVELRIVHLNDTKVTDAGLTKLNSLPNLADIQLNNTRVSDAGLRSLERLKELRVLSVHRTKITDDALAQLKNCRNLGWLFLSDTNITDAGLAHLSNVTGLRWLSLAATRITDVGLTHLQRLTNLRVLNLNETNVSDAGLADLTTLTNLQELFLKGTKISDAGLTSLSALSTLRDLFLAETEISDAGIERLQAALPNCEIRR
ncbi:MAG: hypothetical protein DWQ29_04705 [Planctomycetota bacterium]|nr:MAG: hypothetical protein DWQ29_04705 [Planctomycetota bacterium]